MGNLTKYKEGTRILTEADHVPVRYPTGEMGSLPLKAFNKAIIFHGEEAPNGAIYEDIKAVGILQTNEKIDPIELEVPKKEPEEEPALEEVL
jgi:hypothetical protein